jgi:hypothetical protein
MCSTDALDEVCARFRGDGIGGPPGGLAPPLAATRQTRDRLDAARRVDRPPKRRQLNSSSPCKHSLLPQHLAEEDHLP